MYIYIYMYKFIYIYINIYVSYKRAFFTNWFWGTYVGTLSHVECYDSGAIASLIFATDYYALEIYVYVHIFVFEYVYNIDKITYILKIYQHVDILNDK
jgi:hypothetical protein